MAISDTFCDPSALVTGVPDEAQRIFLRKKCQESLYFLCKAVLGFKDFTPSVHLAACAFIQSQAPKRKLFMLPRGFFKSHIATIGYPIWLIIQEPQGNFRGAEERILIANASATNAEHFLSKIKSIFERNSVFQWLFPELIPDFSSRHILWNVGEASVARKVDYPEPTFSTIGVGGAVVSRHFTRIILDDLVDDKAAVSPELMRKIIDWYKYTESLLEVPGRDEITIIGTRWAFMDLYSNIEETEGEFSPTNPLGVAKHIRSAIENDQPIFPERFNLVELSRLRAKYLDYMFSCLYLNNPRQPGVNDFDISWLQYYRFNEKGKLVYTDGKIADPAEMDKVLIIDIATSMRKEADFSAIIGVGVDEFRNVFILDAWHGRVATKHLIERVFHLARKWQVRAVYYEDSAQQKLLHFALEQHAKETGEYIRIEGVKAGNKQTKEQRVRMVTPYFQQHRVFIRDSMADFIKEVSDFPLGKHDDMIDAFAYFPRCVRFMYPDPPEPTPEELEDAYASMAMDVRLRGRSPVTGY